MARQRVVPGGAPRAFHVADLPEQQVGADHVGASIHPRHVEVRRAEPLGDGRAPFERLVEPVDVAQRHGRVVRHDVVASAHLASDVDGELPRDERLLVSAHPRQDQSLHPGAAQHELGAVRVRAPRGGRRARQLQRPRIVPQPVEVVGMHVVLLRQLHLTRAGHPHLERSLLHLDRALEIAFLAAHREGPAPRTERRCLQVLRADLGGQLGGAPGQRDRLLRLFRPERRPRPGQERLRQVSALELRDQLVQLLVGPGVLLQLGQGHAATETDPAPISIGLREVEGTRVEVIRLVDGARGASAITGREEVLDRPGRFASFAPVVREDPGELRRIGDRRLDHARRGGVQLATEPAGKRGVCDVADQHVLERELHVALDLAVRVSPDEAARLEGLQGRLHIAELADLIEHAAPERLPDHGGVQQRGPRIRRQGVDPRRDRGAHGSRQFAVARLVPQRRHQFLDEQRVPFCRRDDLRDRRRVGSREEGADHLGRLLRRERIQRQRRLADDACAPGGPHLQELRPSEREERHGVIVDMGDQVVDQVQERIVGPVHVFEHQEQRAPFREQLHGATSREQQVDRPPTPAPRRRGPAAARGSASASAASPSGNSEPTSAPSFCRATSTPSFS